jgi:hypothetical protein
MNEQDRKTMEDVRWRINDIRDMLIESRSFNGERLYGIDEWSTPAVNLQRAIALLDAALSRSEQTK